MVQKENKLNINKENNEEIGEKIIKKKVIKKKTLDNSQNENISKINISSVNNKSGDDKNNISNINKSNENNSNNNLERAIENTNIRIGENDSSKIIPENYINKKKHSLDENKSKILNMNFSNMNSSNNNSILINKQKNDIFNLDISNVNAKNTINNFSSNRETLDIGAGNNFDFFKQIKNNNHNTFNINDNSNLNNIPNLKNLNAFNENDNIYFDQVLDNIQKKNRDKHIKKNKDIDKLLNSVNANLVNSKIYGEEKKNYDQANNKDFSNTSNCNNNLLISSNSEFFFDNLNKSPNKFDQEENNDFIVSNKKKKNSSKDELFQINEIVKKKKIISKSKSKIKSNLDNENEIEPVQVYKPKMKKQDEEIFINLNTSREEHNSYKNKKKEFNYEDEILSIPNYNKKNKDNTVTLNCDPYDDLNSRYSKKPNRESFINKNKNNYDLYKNKNGKEAFVPKLELKDLDKQDLLYNDMTYDDSSKKMLESMEILEKAKMQKLKEKENQYENNEEDQSFWTKLGNILNPFKCANYGNPN